jgi:hypothetical protein
MCPRKWWLHSRAKIVPPRKHHFVVGEALHTLSERYSLKQDLFASGWANGLTPAEERWVADSAQEAISRGYWLQDPDGQVEAPFCFVFGVMESGLPRPAEAVVQINEAGVRKILAPTRWADGSPILTPYRFYLVGFIDYWVPRPVRPILRDHKTSKNRRYGKRPEDVLESTQMLTYSAHALAVTGGLETDAGYNVFLKDGAGSYQALETISRSMAAARWATLEATLPYIETALRVPVIGDPKEGNPNRGANCHLVLGVNDSKQGVDTGCKAFGGCDYRDFCEGRCTIEQLTRRLDGECQRALQSQTSSHSSSAQGTTMLKSHAPAIQTGGDYFLVDPDNVKVAYKVHVLSLNGKEAMVAVWPDPEVTPNWATLPNDYTAMIPSSTLLFLQPTSTTLMGYAAAIAAATGAEPPAWEPVVEAGQKGEEVSYGLLVGAKQDPAPVTLPEPPAPSFAAKVGQTVALIDAEFNRSQALIPVLGTPGKVTEVDPDSDNITVEINGLPYPDLASGRFICLADAPAPETPQSLQAQAQGLIGQRACVTLKNIDSSYKFVLEQSDQEGLKLQGVAKAIPWEDVSTIGPYQEPPEEGAKKKGKGKGKGRPPKMMVNVEEIDKALATIEEARENMVIPDLVADALIEILNKAKEGIQAPATKPKSEPEPAPQADEIEKIWQAIAELKALVTGKVAY